MTTSSEDTATGTFVAVLANSDGAPLSAVEAGEATLESGQLYFSGKGVAVSSVGSGHIIATRYFSRNITLAGTTLYDRNRVGLFVAKMDATAPA